MRAKFAGFAAFSLLLSLDAAHAQSVDRARPGSERLDRSLLLPPRSKTQSIFPE